MAEKKTKKNIVQLMGEKFPELEKKKQAVINAAFKTAPPATKGAR